MKFFVRTAIFAALFAFLSCSAAPAPHFTIPGDTGLCPAACVHLRALGCEEGDPIHMPPAQFRHMVSQGLDEATPSACDPVDMDGGVCVSCEAFCAFDQNHGHALNPTCVANKLQSCDQMLTVCK